MKKYRTVFIGNRPLILSSLLSHPEIDLVHAFIVQDSLILEEDLLGTPFTLCHPKDSTQVLNFLFTGQFDICVSGGCPYILPIRKLPPNKIYINSHPSALPFGKGKHPINECILSSHKKGGATLHYLVDEIDAGNIIHQVTFDITDDVDADLLYSFIFDVEKEVFVDGINKLLASNLKYTGEPQSVYGTYYSRRSEDLFADVSSISSLDFLRKVRAFSSDSLGVCIACGDKNIIVFRASLVSNEYIKNRFQDLCAGKLIFINKNLVLLRLHDGVIKIDKWKVNFLNDSN